MKNKLKNISLKIFNVTVQEIALSGILVGLYIIFNMPFLKIVIPVMQISLKYPFLILMGLLVKPFLGIISSIIADNLSMIISGNVGTWSWQYAIIAPAIVVIVCCFKVMLTTKSEKIWWSWNVFLFFGIIVSATIFCFVYYCYPNRFRILSDNTMNIIFLALFISIILSQVVFTLIYWKKKTVFLRNIISILGIVFVVVLIIIWAWGPIAFMIYLKRLGVPLKSYEIYLLSRILKTPFIVPVYTFIIYTVYQASIIVKTKFDKKNSW